MKSFVSVAVAAVACLAAGSALAAEPVVGKLATPLKSRVVTVAGGGVFSCEADTCIANTPGADSNTLRACRDVARLTGAFVSFGTASRPLPAEKLTVCNTSAKK
jgi:hypothetical protein